MNLFKRIMAFFWLFVSIGTAFANLVVTNVFQMQTAFPIQKRFQFEFERALEKRDYPTLENIASNAAAVFPNDSVWHYNLACARARQGFLGEAKKSLLKSCELGFSDFKLMEEDEDLAIIRRDKSFHKALEIAKENCKSPARNPFAITKSKIGSVAMLSSQNVVWDDAQNGFFVFFERPESAPTLPAIPGKTGELIRKWIEDGTAAGNVGDLYDNHDRGHSTLETQFFSGLTPTRYSPDASQYGVDVGTSLFLGFGRPTIGNASMANVSGPFWSSCARKLQNEFPYILISQYNFGVTYVYPQHEDYLPSKEGDVFAMRTPYLFISPGSSWTDKPILASMATALAALHPDVKEYLFKTQQLSAALRYLLYSAQTNVVNSTDYLKPESHPLVFDGNSVDTLKLANLAHSLTTNQIFKVRLIVKNDDSFKLKPGIDYPGYLPEPHLTSQNAISRIWKGTPYSRTMQVEAQNSMPGDYDRCHWIVLQGDKSKVTINDLTNNGKRVEITVQYHNPDFDTPYGIKSSRLDIMCVAEKNGLYSAPSFISYYFPPNEIRTFDESLSPISVDYFSKAKYADPILIPKFDFKDEFMYNGSKKWVQTRRTHADGRVELIERKN